MSLQLYTFNFHALGTPNELQLYAPDMQFANGAATQVISEIKHIEQKYSRYLPDSIVSQINRAAGCCAVEVDPETAGLLDYALSCFEQSGGLFDITSGVLRRAWNFRGSTLPSQTQIEELLPLVGWHKVKWEKPFIQLPIKEMEIDFGGFGKEYAVDRAAETCRACNIAHALVNLGGDVRTLGPHPDGKPWRVGISHPRKEKAILTFVELYEGALATSGDYERFIEVDGMRYCHIVDPRSGWPVQDFQSVSVLAQTCLLAGSIATMAMLCGEKKGHTFLSKLGVPYITVNKVGTIRAYPEMLGKLDNYNTAGVVYA